MGVRKKTKEFQVCGEMEQAHISALTSVPLLFKLLVLISQV